MGSAVSLGVGAAFFMSSSSAKSAAESAPNYASYVESIDRARSHRSISVIALASGAALGGAALLRFATRGAASESQSLAVLPTSSAVHISFAGRF